MEMYQTIASWAGWPAIVAVLLLAGVFAYWVMQRHQNLLEERNAWWKEQLAESRKQSPDSLVRQLNERRRIMEDELERLLADDRSSKETIVAKEAELTDVRANIDALKDQLDRARSIVQAVDEAGLVCPHCGAPLAERTSFSEWMEYDGREIEVGHGNDRYECGLEVVDGAVAKPCPRSLPKS